MNKIVFNSCYGGFGLSNRAIAEICKRKGIPVFFYRRSYEFGKDTVYTKISEEEAIASDEYSIRKCKVDCGESFTEKDAVYKTFDSNYIWEPIDSRHDPILVQVVEELGSKAASGDHAFLEIFETESDLYRIDEYDGAEDVIIPEMDLRSYIRINKK